MDEEVRGLRSTNKYFKQSSGNVKYSIGNGVAKELIPMTHGYEHGVGIARRSGRCWVERGKGAKGKNQDNCTRIINKI